MVKVRTNLPIWFCRTSRMSQVRAHSLPRKHKRSYSSVKAHERKISRDFSKKDIVNLDREIDCNSESSDMFLKPVELYEECGNNRVMVVVDFTFEAKSALQWALSHTLQTQDTIVLLHISKPSKHGGKLNEEDNQRAYQLLASMKNMCETKKLGVQVEIVRKEGKEKGTPIVEAAKKEKITLLVLGQRKQSVTSRIRKIWAGKKRTPTDNNTTVEYCIHNASCMTIAVRKKSKKYGGYLITTKHHKDFWLLA